MKLGVISDCFNVSTEESIKAAASLGLDGIQIYAVKGEFCPENLTDEKIEFYKNLLKEKNLEVSALCGDLGGHGFEIEKDNPARIEKTKKIIDLAEKFGTHVVTTHIGTIPADENHPRYKVMLAAMKECGKYAAEHGVTLAIETGSEIAPTLDKFARAAGKGVGVNLDPANFVMVTDQDPAEAVRIFKELIVHTHVKDGVMYIKTDPEIIYNCFAEGGIEALNISDYFKETPVGTGKVDFKEYFKALKEVGFNGYLTIERETGKDPAADITLAADYVRNNFADYLD